MRTKEQKEASRARKEAMRAKEQRLENKALSMTQSEIVDLIEGVCEYRDVPSYTAEASGRYIYVCKNDGAFHRGDACEEGNTAPGYAHYVGRYTKVEAFWALIYESEQEAVSEGSH